MSTASGAPSASVDQHAGSRAHADARGSAIVLAVIVLMIVGVLIALISMIVIQGSAGERNRMDKATAIRIAETGVNLYRIALENDVTNERNGYQIPAAKLGELLTSVNAGAVAPGSLPPGLRNGDNGIPVILSARIRTPRQAGGVAAAPTSRLAGNFQILSVRTPQFSLGRADDAMVIYIRAWLSKDDGTPATEPAIVRSELRPGGFQAFQLLTDTPILFWPGARINGPVHSNANSITAPAGVACSGDGKLSFAGSPLGSIAGCPLDPRPPRVYSLSRVGIAIDRINKECGAGATPGTHVQFICAGGGADVVIGANSVSAGGDSRSVANGQGVVVRVNGDARVTQTAATNARVTVVAAKPAGGVAGNIRIASNISSNGSAGGVVGLIAQGNIIPEIPGCPVRSIEAALVSQNGAVTIDPRWITQIEQVGAPDCPGIAIKGSIASYSPPVLQYRWNSGEVAGFHNRTYSWDPTLIRRSPPFAPTTDGWTVLDQRLGDADCLRTANGGAMGASGC